jgi:DNA repair protein RadA/Sms
MRENGIYGVENYDNIFVSDELGKNAGSVITPSISGNRCMMVELQCLLSKTIFGMPRRMPLGIDYNRMVLIIAVLERKAYIPFYNQDVYLNAMGGIKLQEPAIDLAIALSLVSASKNIPISKDVTAFGELGLTGEIRGVTYAEKRVLDAVKFGFKTIFVPYPNFDSVKKHKDKINIIPVSYVSQAIKKLFSESEQSNV